MASIPVIDKEWANPVAKAITTLGELIGLFSEPSRKRKMVTASAEEIKIATEALKDSLYPGKYENGKVSLYKIPDESSTQSSPQDEDSEDSIQNPQEKSPVQKRIENRIAYQEQFKQRNLELILHKTIRKLENIDSFKDDAVETEWTLRFLSTVELICSEQLQDLWASVLAAKIRDPNAVSLRTLELIKNLTADESKLFKRVIPYVLVRSDENFLWCAGNVLTQFGITPADIQLLDECGLVQSSETNLIFTRDNADSYANCFHNTRTLIKFHMDPRISRISFRQFPLTTAGRELYHILRTEPEEAQMTKIIDSIISHRKSLGIKLTLHKHLGDDKSFAHENTIIRSASGLEIPTESSPVNINTANVSQLTTLSGIGEVYANLINEHRKTYGRFNTIDDLKKVKGIKENRFDKIKHLVIV